ncbi:MAG: hypothetical protein UW24_C0003G0023 [Parcubacteria group bacterium GW2011_GWA2_44_12]|nr:MAG: hypothetical protein UW24_C0003G0023 [Parcubacteria group bacterium GW2011_GWA2_44_12]
MEFLLLFELALLLLLFVIALFIVRFLLHRRAADKVSFSQRVLLLTLPKESEESDQNAQEKKKETKDIIAVAENLYANLYGLKDQSALSHFFYGEHTYITLEIVAINGLIKFFIIVPHHIQGYAEQQIHAQYPHAQIEDVEDYNIFSPTCEVKAAYLGFKRDSIFPIKTYKDQQSDPLNALTNSLSKIPEMEGAAIQFTIKPAHAAWTQRGIKIASAMQQGKSLKEATGQGTIMKNVSDAFSGAVTAGLSDVRSNFITASDKESGGDKMKKDYKLSPLEEEIAKGLEAKAGLLGFECNLRIVVASEVAGHAEIQLNNIVNAFGQYELANKGNGFKKLKMHFWNRNKIIDEFIFRTFNKKRKIILNTQELTSLWHPPLPQTETPNILWLAARKAPAPVEIPREGIMLGYNVYRGVKTMIRMKDDDRRRHAYIIGKSGSGKSTLMLSMMIQDIQDGKGVGVIDPHGDLVDEALAHVPKDRIDDVLYFEPANTARPMSLNLLEYDPKYPDQKTFVINEMIKVFDKLYDLKATGGPMFEQYMRNAMLLIMDDPDSGSTLLEISRVLADENFRKYKLSKCKTQVVKDFWEKEAQKAGGEASLQNMVPYITSKLNPFIANDIMRPIISQQKSSFNVRDVMDNKKILLLNLSKGRLGEINAYLIGMVMVGKILMAALSRTDLPKNQRSDFYLYIDEFQNFITDSIAIILSEARKYGLDLIVAHQYIGQLVKNNDQTIKNAIFGNVGTLVSFRIGSEDAKEIVKEFQPIFNEFDLINVDKHSANIKLLIDNTTSKPFNMKIDLPEEGNIELADAIKDLSRLKYGRDRAVIDKEIADRVKKAELPKPPAFSPFKSPFGSSLSSDDMFGTKSPLAPPPPLSPKPLSPPPFPPLPAKPAHPPVSPKEDSKTPKPPSEKPQPSDKEIADLLSSMLTPPSSVPKKEDKP